MDGSGYGAIMPANPAPFIAAGAVGALGGPTAGAWAHWLVSSVSRPEFREAAYQTGNTVASAAKESAVVASGWLDDTIHHCERDICIGPWSFAIVVAALALLVCAGLVSASCGCATAGGGGWLAAKRADPLAVASTGRPADQSQALALRAQELLALDALARDVIAGGPILKRAAAANLGVSQQAFEEWCSAWFLAMRGPKRQ
jgi:hypothetical protein